MPLPDPNQCIARFSFKILEQSPLRLESPDPTEALVISVNMANGSLRNHFLPSRCDISQTEGCSALPHGEVVFKESPTAGLLLRRGTSAVRAKKNCLRHEIRSSEGFYPYNHRIQKRENVVEC